MTWLLGGLGLSVFFWLSGAAGLHLWPLRPITNLAELALTPFSILAAMIFPAHDYHHSQSYYLARSLLGGFGYLTALWLVLQVARLLRALREHPVDGKRRGLLTGLLLTPILGTALYSVLVEPSWLKLRRYELKIAGLPPELDGLKIGHFSDSHFGPLVGLMHIRQAIAMLNAEQPDLVLLTGDYVHQTPSAIPDGIAVLTELKSRLGTLAVLGNHDHWEGTEACRAEFARHGLPLLDNQRVFLSARGLSDQPVDPSLAICGVGDLWEDTVDPEKALQDVPEDCPRLLLSHNPDVAELFPDRFPRLRFDLQLSGHTHGGQVSFPGVGTPIVPSAYGPRYAGGLVQGPAWPVVVSRGVGLTVLPVRFRVPPEVGLITLRRG